MSFEKASTEIDKGEIGLKDWDTLSIHLRNLVVPGNHRRTQMTQFELLWMRSASLCHRTCSIEMHQMQCMLKQ